MFMLCTDRMSTSVAGAQPTHRDLSVIYRPVADLKPDPRNARTHSKRQVEQLCASILQFGFTNPVLVDEAGVLIAGHGRLRAAKELGLATVPVIELLDLSDAQKKALRLADNKIALNAGWDLEILKLELADIGTLDVDFDLSLTGFASGEIDIVLKAANDPDDEVIPAVPAEPKSRIGDVWILGDHRVGCGDGRDVAFLKRIVGEGASIDAAFLDPPYNVKINGHANARGRHREFAMASGEMSDDQFRSFLRETLGAAASVSRDGAVHFVSMDWRHLDDVSAVGLALPIQTRDDLGQPCRVFAPRQHGRAWQAWSQPHQRLGLPVGQLDGGQPPRGPGAASHGKAGGDGCRCVPGCNPARRSRVRHVPRFRHVADRR